MFSVEDRDRAQARVLELADEDARVADGRAVGSLTTGGGDRFSDLDLTFAVADGVALTDVLGDWTRVVERELGGVVLFDVSSGPSIYRVFLLPGCLQLDLSFTPVAQFVCGWPNWTSAVRDYALQLACWQRGLPEQYGRGFDDLPADVLAPFADAIVRLLERDEILRALRVAADGLLREGEELPELRALVEADTLS